MPASPLLPRAPAAGALTRTLVIALGAGLLWLGGAPVPQARAQAAQPASPPAAEGMAIAPAAPSPPARLVASGSRPVWKELSAAQRTALGPLGNSWEQLSEAQRR